jgi:hypothetical protein
MVYQHSNTYLYAPPFLYPVRPRRAMQGLRREALPVPWLQLPHGLLASVGSDSTVRLLRPLLAERAQGLLPGQACSATDDASAILCSAEDEATASSVGAQLESVLRADAVMAAWRVAAAVVAGTAALCAVFMR